MSAVQNSRLSFAKIPKVLDIPDLLIIQKDSFKWFIEEGLKEILDEISPIEDFSGRFSLEFLNHYFEEPLKTLEDCKITDSTYSIFQLCLILELSLLTEQKELLLVS